MAEKSNAIEKEIRAEIKRRKKKPQRQQKSRVRHPWLLALALVAVLGAVGFAAYRGLNSGDSLRRLYTYSRLEKDADGRAELFRYDSDRSATYAMLGDGLISVSTTRIRLLGSDGGELWARTVNFKRPAIVVGKQTAAVYDIGGQELYLFTPRGLMRDMSGLQKALRI